MSDHPTKTNAGRFFEDFEVGAELVHAVPRTITEGDQSLYIALTGDRFPLHASNELARGLGYERAPVNDLLVFHIVFGKTVTDVSLNAIANLGYADLRFLLPVYPGDTLRATSTVIGKRENRSGETGIVWVRTRGENQRGQSVLEYVRWVMVRKREPSKPAPSVEPPSLPESVASSTLGAPRCLDLARLGEWCWALGGSAFFDDYRIGEVIHHVDGMTLEETEHAMATRLYQNTAKVHFDARLAKETRFGRRIVYGGHVMSLARALSFNGLENSLCWLAVNAGSHVNPCFAGDTVYALSEVLDAARLPGQDDCGALRLRLIATKDLDPSESALEVQTVSDGRKTYDPHVLLDLDYWVLVPKRP